MIVKMYIYLVKKNYKEIPNYIYYSDVALIPFEVNELTNSVSPIKLYEYMSLGLNVVSTNLKEVKYINSPAYIADSYEKFVNYIKQAIKNKDKDRQRNIRFSKENTWNKRFEKNKGTYIIIEEFNNEQSNIYAIYIYFNIM